MIRPFSLPGRRSAIRPTPPRKRVGLALVAVTGTFVAGLAAGTAGAASDPVSDAVAVLKNPIHHIYIDPAAPGQQVVNPAQTTQDIGTQDIKVAVLPASALSPKETPALLAATIGNRIADPHAVVIVIVGQQPGAAAGDSTGIQQGTAETVMINAQAAHRGPFTLALVQATLDQAIATYVEALTANGTPAATPSSNSSGSSSKVWEILLAVVLVLLALASVIRYLVLRKNDKREEAHLPAARAEVESLYERLGADVSGLDPGSDPIAQQAHADASARYAAAGLELAGARSLDELAEGRRATIEGLAASRVVRLRLGLDPGQDPVAAVPAGPQVIGEQSVTVGDTAYVGHAVYMPGSPFYFAGGWFQGNWVPGGWFAQPFWEQHDIPELIVGGFGGWGQGAAPAEPVAEPLASAEVPSADPFAVAAAPVPVEAAPVPDAFGAPAVDPFVAAAAEPAPEPFVPPAATLPADPYPAPAATPVAPAAAVVATPGWDVPTSAEPATEQFTEPVAEPAAEPAPATSGLWGSGAAAEGFGEAADVFEPEPFVSAAPEPAVSQVNPQVELPEPYRPLHAVQAPATEPETADVAPETADVAAEPRFEATAEPFVDAEPAAEPFVEPQPEPEPIAAEPVHEPEPWPAASEQAAWSAPVDAAAPAEEAVPEPVADAAEVAPPAAEHEPEQPSYERPPLEQPAPYVPISTFYADREPARDVPPPVTLAEPEPEPGPEPEPEVVPESEPVAEPAAFFAPEPEAEPIAAVEHVTEAEPEPAAAFEPESVAHVEPAPVVESVPEPIAVPEPVATVEPVVEAPEPVAPPKVERAFGIGGSPETFVAPVAVPAAEPEPVAHVEPEPPIEPEPAVAAEPVVAAEPAPEPVAAPEPEPEPVPVAAHASEPAASNGTAPEASSGTAPEASSGTAPEASDGWGGEDWGSGDDWGSGWGGSDWTAESGSSKGGW